MGGGGGLLERVKGCTVEGIEEAQVFAYRVIWLQTPTPSPLPSHAALALPLFQGQLTGGGGVEQIR